MQPQQKDPASSGGTPSDPFAAAQLRGLIMGFRVTLLIHVAAKLRLADHLAEEPRAPELLARDVGADPDALRRVLRALASLGIFAETPEGEFTSTPLADLLRGDAPGSLRPLAVLYGEEWLWQAYGRILRSVETGHSGFEDAHGMSFYDYLEINRSAGQTFDEAMTGYSALEAHAIATAYDLSAVRRVIDIGGGHGGLVAALLEANDHLSAVVFDRESVVQGARLADAELGSRVQWVAGDFFTRVPSEGDLYVLKSILHNWDDGRASSILSRCREAMGRQSRILIIERLLPTGTGPSEAKLFDINMLVVAGGRERTEAEYRGLLRGAGLELRQVIATESPLSILEAEVA
jgi:O-methyltransferase domain/Dimerisation domain